MNKLVTHLAKAYFPIPGGIENLTQLFCENLVKNEIQAKVISFSELSSSNKKQKEVINGVEVLRVRPFGRLYSQPLSIQYLLETYKSLGESKEIHVHWPNFLAFFSVFLSFTIYKLLLRTPPTLIIHWHGDAVRQRPIRFLFSPLVNVVIHFSKRLVLSAKFYAEISDFKDSLVKKEIFEAPLIVSKEFEETLNQLGGANLITYKNSPFKILSIGRYVWLKGFQDLIEASELCRHDVEVIIIGAKDKFLDQLHALRAKLKNPNKITLLTNLSAAEMIQHIRSAHLFVMPSRQEMAGIVQMEAMLCGKAVITTDIPRSAVNYFNEKNITGLVVPVANPKALAEAIDNLASDPERLRLLSENALKKAQKEFTNAHYSKAIKEYVKKYLTD